MTILNQNGYNEHVGNGATVAFNFDFKLFSQDDLKVYDAPSSISDPADVTAAHLKTLTTHYTVAINPVTEGGVVTFLVAPVAGRYLLLRREVPNTQPADIPNVGSIREEVIEQELDRACMRDIRLSERIEALGALTGPTGATGATGATGPAGDDGEDGEDGDRYASTSVTSLLLAGSGQKTLTIGTGLQYSAGQTVLIANDATHYMVGTVDTYNSGTGVLVATMTSVVGAGTFASWAVNLNGAAGPAGPAGATGATGATGAAGAAGPQGDPGVGAETGTMVKWAGREGSIPSGWLERDGSAVSRVTYADLFALLCPSSIVTMTIASPSVITWAAHKLVVGDKVRFTTTGALPTGLALLTDYYVVSANLAANTFSVSALPGGTAITTSGSQSGVHTAQRSTHGLGDLSTTFNLPAAQSGYRWTGRQIFTVSGTWTKPEKCNRVLVKSVGGGGGGGGTVGNNGSAGGDTTFGAYHTAGGGAGGTANGAGGAGGTATDGTLNIAGQRGGSRVAAGTVGGAGGSAGGGFGLGGAIPANGAGGIAGSGYGGGGSGWWQASGALTSSGGGGGGGYVEEIIDSPDATVTVTIGAAGGAGASGGAGVAGIVIVDEFSSEWDTEIIKT